MTTCEDLVSIALSLRERVNLPERQLYRLVGVGLSNFRLEGASEDASTGTGDESSDVSLIDAQEKAPLFR